jgi:uncharacterized protein YbjT (DUF2867 family)
MDIAVIGGTGTLGALVVAELVRRGHQVRVISRSATTALPRGVTHYQADVRTGAGLDAALAGAMTVLDAVNNARGDAEVLVGGTRRLLQAEARAGVGHHVAISVVGCDRLSLGYFRAKARQEEVVMGGPVSWSLLRATQFHGYVAGMLAGAAKWRVSPRGQARVQPIDAGVVASRLVAAIEAGPAGRLPDIGGPEQLTLTQLARRWCAVTGRHLLPLYLPLPGKTGAALRQGILCTAETPAHAGSTFAEWLARQTDAAKERGRSAYAQS